MCVQYTGRHHRQLIVQLKLTQKLSTRHKKVWRIVNTHSCRHWSWCEFLYDGTQVNIYCTLYVRKCPRRLILYVCIYFTWHQVKVICERRRWRLIAYTAKDCRQHNESYKVLSMVYVIRMDLSRSRSNHVISLILYIH